MVTSKITAVFLFRGHISQSPNTSERVRSGVSLRMFSYFDFESDYWCVLYQSIVNELKKDVNNGSQT